jgi:hypothetical protein
MKVEMLESRTLLSGSPLHVYAPHSTVRGQSLGQWAAGWLQWALSIPADQSPLTDKTGEFAGVGQPRDVFFLAGNFGGADARTFTAPSGTPLFFPVINNFWVNQEGVDPPFAQNEANIRADFDKHVAAFTAVFATVDGVPVQDLASHVEEDPPGGFQIDFPQNNVFGLPPEELGLAATKGIYLMIGPLSPGEHVIHFGGTDPIFGFSLDVTDHITIVPKGQYRKDVAGAPAAKFATTPIRRPENDRVWDV